MLCLACVIFKLKRPSVVRSSDVRQKVPFIEICILILGHPPLLLFSLGLGLYHVKLAPSDANLPVTLQRMQFPVRLAYSMTINKSQGQTFDKLGIYLPAPVFSHGQLYVAFSRARGYSYISIKVDNNSSQGLFSNKTLTQNVIYREVL